LSRPARSNFRVPDEINRAARRARGSRNRNSDCASCATPAAGNAARELAGLLRKRGDLDGLRALAEVGDQDAAEQLASAQNVHTTISPSR
jgi:hypothetical protein